MQTDQRTVPSMTSRSMYDGDGIDLMDEMFSNEAVLLFRSPMRGSDDSGA